MISLRNVGLTPFKLAKRSWNSITQDDIFGRAAALAYYFVLALFPLLFFLVSLLGLLAGPGSEMRASLLGYLGRVAPGSASDLISKTLDEIVRASGGGKLTFGILAALWSASAGVSAMMDGLNIAYHVKETRGFIKREAVAVGLTIGLSALVTVALTLILYGGRIAGFIAARIGAGNAFVRAWDIIQWPLVLAFMLFAFSLVYYFAPNLEAPKWEWITPGAIVGLGLWIAVSVAFRVYLNFFNSYNKAYGSMGAAIILLLWLYFSGAAILIGGEINAQIKHAELEHREAEERRQRMLRVA
jgi:membrane protein